MALTAGRTLSSRVLAGFVVLIVVFTATMVWIVSYMNDLRSEIALIRTSYLPLPVRFQLQLQKILWGNQPGR